VGLEQRVLRRWRGLDAPPDAVVVVGFSGGGDSLALGAALGRIAAKGGVRPLLVHIDHGLRAGSDEEQTRARELAGALGLPFRGMRARENPLERHRGVGTEEAARRERYRALATVVAETGAAVVALAHHQEDQAETVLSHLLRGAGLTGAAGMAERRDLLVPWWEETELGDVRWVPLWRPFLTEARATVRRYAAKTGLTPIEDPSNWERVHRRNELRHEAIPLLERIWPGATAALARFGELAAADDVALETMADAAYERAALAGDALRRVSLAEEPVAVRRRVVRRWLRERTGSRAVTADRIEAVLGLVQPGAGGRRVETGEGWGVWVDGGALRVTRLPGAGGAGRGSDDE
jgi:tRNA(Ile)-lysidine synthase